MTDDDDVSASGVERRPDQTARVLLVFGWVPGDCDSHWATGDLAQVCHCMPLWLLWALRVGGLRLASSGG